MSVTGAMVAEVFQASPILFDRNGDYHYDSICAFIKSMRGGDADASLYWLARLIHSGEDPRFIARRILIHASEDVGLADNTALQIAVAALQAVQHVGYPEAQIVLAHAALHICRAPNHETAPRQCSGRPSVLMSVVHGLLHVPKIRVQPTPRSPFSDIRSRNFNVRKRLVESIASR